ncbi:hypothetical protein RyT2_27630 [Pseudolactococcus yaeyamensis]
MTQKKMLLVVKDEQIAWLNHQNNATASLRALIHTAIERFGSSDLFEAALISTDLLADIKADEKDDVDLNQPHITPSEIEIDNDTEDFSAMLGLN